MTNWRASAGLATAIVAAAGLALAETPRPKPRPETGAAITSVAPASAVTTVPKPRPAVQPDPAAAPAAAAAESSAQEAAPQADAAEPVVAAPEDEPRDPNRGAVTNLPLPRYVSLKTNEGNARRGPGLTHRIDWVFTRAGMPLKITAEYENWRRVEDVDGLGGWVHYSLLSGVRSVIVKGDMVDFHTLARPDAAIAFRAEAGVVGRVLSCKDDWCRIQTDGGKGWAPLATLWGIDPGEVID